MKSATLRPASLRPAAPRLVIRRLALAAAFLLFTVPAAHGQEPPPDLTGQWLLGTTVQLSGEASPCVFEGIADIAQQGTQLSGTARLSLVSGPAACPAVMTAELSGAVEDGEVVSLTGMLGGQLGTVDFTGTLSPNPGGGGDFTVTSGPFQGEEGTWTAQLVQSAAQIPTLVPLGLALLALALVAAGTLFLRRRAA